jgi:P27 family predicted phage terminase small subunit
MPAQRTTTAQKRVRGTLRNDRARPLEPGARLLRTPPPPASLSEGAAEEWKRLAPVATKLGTLTAADLRAFELCCEMLATERRARSVVDREGLAVPTADGGRKGHPAVKVMETARAQAARLLGDFGLVPRGRMSIDPAPPPELAGDPAERFFRHPLLGGRRVGRFAPGDDATEEFVS